MSENTATYVKYLEEELAMKEGRVAELQRRFKLMAEAPVAPPMNAIINELQQEVKTLKAAAHQKDAALQNHNRKVSTQCVR